jgi:uncharacterized protein
MNTGGMLRSFRVCNHQSLRDETELSLLPASDKDRAVVPVAAIFGSNAAGKSSLLSALKFMQSAVKLSFATWEPDAGVRRTPFRLAPRSLLEPSTFVADIMLDWVPHVYGFTVDDEKVQSEWLYTYAKRRKKVVFERQGNDVEFGPASSAEAKTRNKFILGMLRSNALFVSTAAQALHPDIKPLYDWFAQRVAFLPAAQEITTAALYKKLALDSPDRDTLVDLIRAADVGIADIRVVDAGWRDRAVDAEESAAIARAEMESASGRRRLELAEHVAYYDWLTVLREARSLSLEFYHGQAMAPLSLEHQSEGTRAWLGMVLHSRQALDTGSALIVDELDASLHPRLTTRLVRLFQSRRTNPRGAQLIFSSHDATLLGTAIGEDVLQRDQIWFVDKDSEGASSVYPLTDFHPEQGEDVERRYLGGAYGAVPVVSELAFRRAMREKEDPSEPGSADAA